MKKIIALLFSTIVMLNITSCSNKNNQTSDSETDLSETVIDISGNGLIEDGDSEKETYPDIPIIKEENGDVYIPISPEEASIALKEQAEKEANQIPEGLEAYEMTGYWTNPQNNELLFKNNCIYTVEQSTNKDRWFDEEGHYTELGTTMNYKYDGSTIIVSISEFPDYPIYQLERIGDPAPDSIDGEYKLINYLPISNYPDFEFTVYYIIEDGYVSIKNKVGKYTIDENNMKITMYSPTYSVVEGSYTVKGDMIVIVDEANKTYIYKKKP